MQGGGEDLDSLVEALGMEEAKVRARSHSSVQCDFNDGSMYCGEV